jgi:hypothetical protein
MIVISGSHLIAALLNDAGFHIEPCCAPQPRSRAIPSWSMGPVRTLWVLHRIDS